MDEDMDKACCWVIVAYFTAWLGLTLVLGELLR